MISSKTLDEVIEDIKQFCLYEGGGPPDLPDEKYQVVLLIASMYCVSDMDPKTIRKDSLFIPLLETGLAALKEHVIASGVVEGHPENLEET